MTAPPPDADEQARRIFLAQAIMRGEPVMYGFRFAHAEFSPAWGGPSHMATCGFDQDCTMNGRPVRELMILDNMEADLIGKQPTNKPDPP